MADEAKVSDEVESSDVNKEPEEGIQPESSAGASASEPVEETVTAVEANLPAAGEWPEPYEERKALGKYEYLDHPADVQLHSWGDTLKEAFEQSALAMFDYITDVSCVERKETETVEAQGDDLHSLLYHFLDEWLFVFSADPFFIPREVIIDEFDLKNFRIVSRGIGEMFDLCKHPQGTEVKAITYSNMQIKTDPPYDIYVIIDI